MWTTTTTTAASVALVTAVSMVPAPQEAAISITGAEITRDRAALEAGLAWLGLAWLGLAWETDWPLRTF